MDLAATLLGGVSLVNDIFNPGQAQDKRDVAKKQAEADIAEAASAKQVAAEAVKKEQEQTQQIMYIAIAAGVIGIAAIGFLALKK